MNGVRNKVISENNRDDRKNENDSHFTTVQPNNDNNNGNNVEDSLNHKQNGVHCAAYVIKSFFFFPRPIG